MANTFTSSNYDGKTCLQLHIEVSESDFASDGSYSTVTANYYLMAVNNPYNAFSGDVTSDYGTGQTVSCSIGSKSNIFSTNAFLIANAINNFGDKFYIGSLSSKVNRSNSGNANIRVACSCTLVWRSGYPSRSVSGTYKCTNTKSIVSYDANGGTNAPYEQTKYYGHVLTLRDSIPIRPGYIFKGWSTSADGAVLYASGDKYELDVDVTLYAVWKMVDVDIELTGVDIEIPCQFYLGVGGFKYFYCDGAYQVYIPYAYAFPDKIDTAYAKVGDSEYKKLYATSGQIPVGINELSEYIRKCKSESYVDIPIDFRFQIGNDDVEISKVVSCNLINFNYIDVKLHHTYVSRSADNLVYVVFLVAYPKSYNPDVKYINSFPFMVYLNNGVVNALDCVGRIEIGDNLFLITYSVNTNDLSNPITVMYPGIVLVHIDNYDALDTLRESDFLEQMIITYVTSNDNKITLKKTGQVIAKQFVEVDYLGGFYRGGYVCMNEFIEDSNNTNIKITPDSIFTKELIEE